MRGVVWIALIGGGLWLVAESNTTSSTDRPSLGRVADSLPPAVARPQAGILSNWTGRPPQAPLEIVTSPGADYYLKLVDAITGRDAVAIYVNGGRRIEVNVPVGSYRLRYASGSTWRGTLHLFGPGNLTSYNEAQSTFNFEVSGGYISGYTVELIRQAGGNLDTRSINPSQF